MSVIIILIIIGIIVAGGFLAGFIWAVKSGQYDDTYSPAVRMLFDDSKEKTESTSVSKDDSESKTK
ncbi:MAG: cbb3-type cytochrome oxidase assembly protein CcoS [Chlorobi bacterium]|nr:cbb3-type cytochrome oxidase assembly protein CcoS [Chlorobiota bacterium]